MTLQEAKEYIARLEARTDRPAMVSEPVRILPAHIDPIQEGDNGWDVETTILEDW